MEHSFSESVCVRECKWNTVVVSQLVSESVNGTLLESYMYESVNETVIRSHILYKC